MPAGGQKKLNLIRYGTLVNESHSKHKNTMSRKAQEFISHKISKLADEGYPPKQRVAIAFSIAREKGFEVPRKKGRKK